MKIKEILPWRLKMVLKIILSRMPLGYTFWKKVGIFRHGQMDQASYALNSFNKYLRYCKLNRKDIKGKTILELGPGDSISTALIASSYGAKTILIDVGNYAFEDVSVYQLLANELRLKGVNVPNIEAARSLDEILNICNAKYFTNGLEGFHSLQDNSIDLVVSKAVLEHIYKDEFFNVMQECHRIMRENAVSIHTIDLKDHLNKALNNLRFSHNFWESKFISNSGFYTNRIRYSEMLELFKNTGFSISIVSKNTWNELPTPRWYIAHPFNLLTDDELCVSEFTVLLRRSNTTSI